MDMKMKMMMTILLVSQKSVDHSLKRTAVFTAFSVLHTNYEPKFQRGTNISVPHTIQNMAHYKE